MLKAGRATLPEGSCDLVSPERTWRSAAATGRPGRGAAPAICCSRSGEERTCCPRCGATPSCCRDPPVRVAVTGASGLIGRALRPELERCTVTRWRASSGGPPAAGERTGTAASSLPTPSRTSMPSSTWPVPASGTSGGRRRTRRLVLEQPGARDHGGRPSRRRGRHAGAAVRERDRLLRGHRRPLTDETGPRGGGLPGRRVRGSGRRRPRRPADTQPGRAPAHRRSCCPPRAAHWRKQLPIFKRRPRRAAGQRDAVAVVDQHPGRGRGDPAPADRRRVGPGQPGRRRTR